MRAYDATSIKASACLLLPQRNLAVNVSHGLPDQLQLEQRFLEKLTQRAPKGRANPTSSRPPRITESSPPVKIGMLSA